MCVYIYIYTLWRTLTIHLLCPKGLSGFHLMQHKIHIPCSGLHGPAQSHPIILMSSPPPLCTLPVKHPNWPPCILSPSLNLFSPKLFLTFSNFFFYQMTLSVKYPWNLSPAPHHDRGVHQCCTPETSTT